MFLVGFAGIILTASHRDPNPIFGIAFIAGLVGFFVDYVSGGRIRL